MGGLGRATGRVALKVPINVAGPGRAAISADRPRL
jgi:hypothetical protein